MLPNAVKGSWGKYKEGAILRKIEAAGWTS
jgi:hypothetical protein